MHFVFCEVLMRIVLAHLFSRSSRVPCATNSIAQTAFPPDACRTSCGLGNAVASFACDLVGLICLSALLGRVLCSGRC